MSSYTSSLRWTRNNSVFEYATYTRDHVITVGSGVVLPTSAAPDYRGSDGRVNPEEMLVAALSSCHMLTFLAVAAKKKMVVESYADEASGVLEKGSDGKLWVTRVTLRPRIVFGGTVDAATATAMHHEAHRGCFIANSVKTVVTVEETS